jgi:PEP-CTERM motif
MKTLWTVSYFIVATLSLLIFVDSAHAIKVLMHGRDATANFRDDPFIYQHLQTQYGIPNVTYMQGSTAAADGSSAAGFDVVFISSTMASGDTRNKYEDATIGVVFDEAALVHDNNIGNSMLTDNNNNQDGTPSTLGRRFINILDSTHPLAAGLSGQVTVFNTTPTDTYWWQIGRGQLAPGVNRIAESLLDVAATGVSGDYGNNSNAGFSVDAGDYVVYRKNEGGAAALPNDNGMATPVGAAHYNLWRSRYGNSSAANDGNQHAILAAEVGAALYGNGATGSPATAAGRRVFFFVSDFGFFDLTADGVKLFDAAIDWAAAHPGSGSGSLSTGVPEPTGLILAAIGFVGLAFRRHRYATS